MLIRKPCPLARLTVKPVFPIDSKDKGATPLSTALRIAAIYALAGVSWILVSDLVLFHNASEDYDPELWGGIIKGILFVLGSAALIFWLLQRELSHREQAHEKLNFIQQLNELSNDPVYVLDPTDDFRLVYVNAAAVRHFGYSREKLLTMRIRDWDPKYANDNAKEKWEALRTERFAVFESEHHLADGRVVPVEISTNYIQFQGKEYAGGYFRNIADRQKVAQALRENQAMLTEVVNTAPQAIFWKDTKGVYLGCNEVFAKDAGLKSPKEVIGKTDYDLPWGKTEAEAYRADDQAVIANCQPKRHIVEPLTRHDGQKIWLSTSKAPLLQPDGKAFGVLGVYEDITVQKLAEERLRESEERLRLATKAAGIGIWDVDLLTNKTVWDRQILEIYGVAKADLSGTKKDWEELIHPDDQKRVKSTLEIAASTQQERNLEYRIIRPNGEIRHIRSAATIIRNEEGKAVRILGVNYDVTASYHTRALLDESQRNARLGGWEYLVPNQKLVWTDETYRIHELPPGTPVDVTKAIDYYAGESKTKIREVFEHLLATGEGYDCELQFVTAKGKPLWVRCTGQADFVEGKPHRVFGTIQDITAQHQAQQELRESEQLFTGVFDSALDGLFLVDWETRSIKDCNQQAVIMFEGASKAEMIGKFGYEWQRFARTPEAMKEMQQRIAGGETWLEEVEYRTFQGNYFWGQLAIRKLDIADSHLALVRITNITSLKQTQEQLRQERDFSRWTMDVLPGVFYVIEADGRIRNWNPQLERITGRNAGQIKGINCLELLHPDDHASVLVSIQNVLSKEEDQIDARLVALDGSAHPHHFQGRRIELDGSQCILGIGIDISERLAMEEQVKQQLHFQKTLMKTIPVPIFIKDMEGRFLDVNPALEELLGRQRESLRGKTVTDLTAPPELIARYQEKDRELMANGTIQAYESNVRTKNGELRGVIFHKAIFRHSDGSAQGIVGAIQDITELRQITQRLQLQESALNAAANGIVITDPEGHIVWANPAFSILTGFALEEAVGLNSNLLKSGRQDTDFYGKMWQTIKVGNVWHGELVNKRKDGTFYDEEMTITPVKDGDGKVINFIAIKQDITERKQLEQQYLRAQRMEGIGLLAGGIAHDLNNVLAPILMSVQLLQEMHPDEETQDILTTLQTTTQRGADIVRQVLTFARGIKGDRILLEPKHLIKDILRVAKEAFPRNIQIESKVAPDLWNIVGDPTQLHQVLLNLTINARDAMPDGGTLKINAYNGEGHQEISALDFVIAPGEYAIISVKDTGTGIPLDKQDKIFEPFFTTKEIGKGTGLGLSTVMGIIKSHRGYVQVKSTPGIGTEFLIYLPAVKRQITEQLATAEVSLPLGKGETILFVDDETSIREIARDILVRKNYQVLLAGDGTEALSVVVQQPDRIKLVITDIMMPFMDGVALARALRKMHPGMKIITCSGLTSGASMASKIEELRQMGIPNILHKPFTAQVLLNYVDCMLNDRPLDPEGLDS